MIDLVLNPITQKRLKRFKKIRRSYWSFWILIILYTLSLGSELICNDRPIYVKFQGKSYFPVYNYYPDSEFTNSGKSTRADYKTISQSTKFKENSSNFMIFAPVPYGPNEIISPESLDIENVVDVKFLKQPRAGTINILADYTIVKSQNCGFFFNRDNDAVRALNLVNYWQLTEPIKQAIEQRFKNLASDPVAGIISTRPTNQEAKCQVSLSTFKRRRKPPKTVRVTLREVQSHEGSTSEKVIFSDTLKIKNSDQLNLWQNLSESDKQSINETVRIRFENPVDPYFVDIDRTQYKVIFDKKDVRWPYDPIKNHWLGIDSAGRDVLARIIYGLRISMTFGLILVLFSMSLGVIIGAVQGYYGGKIDIITQRVIEIWSALPFLYIMILLGSIYGRSFTLLLIIYGIFNWISISYYMRAEFLKLRSQSFVEVAKCQGLPAHKIILKHILPNSLVPLITFMPFSLVGAIGSLAALDYLGFGLPPPTSSWGEMLAQAQVYRWAWWLILYPSLALFIVMLLGVFIGEGVRNAFDPRTFNKIR